MMTNPVRGFPWAGFLIRVLGETVSNRKGDLFLKKRIPRMNAETRPTAFVWGVGGTRTLHAQPKNNGCRFRCQSAQSAFQNSSMLSRMSLDRNGTFLVCRAPMDGERILAIINKHAGGAADAARILNEVGGYEVHEVVPDEVAQTVRQLAAKKPKRMLVAGGDGSLCTAAHILAETGIELAILPAGTLNHLAKDLGLPNDLREAAIVAREGITRTIDAGRVNDKLFLNTSSVGAYESFVRRRESLEARWGYHVASLIAGWQILIRAPNFDVTVEVAGATQVYRTPLVFVGVGERELRIPALGRRADHAKHGLHLMIVRSRSGARRASLAIQAAARGVEAMSRTPAMGSLVVNRFVIDAPVATASIDGELIRIEPPLEYQFLPAALSVVVSERREAARPVRV